MCKWDYEPAVHKPIQLPDSEIRDYLCEGPGEFERLHDANFVPYSASQ